MGWGGERERGGRREREREEVADPVLECFHSVVGRQLRVMLAEQLGWKGGGPVTGRTRRKGERESRARARERGVHDALFFSTPLHTQERDGGGAQHDTTRTPSSLLS